MPADRELLGEVLVEGREMLSRLDRDLVRLEERPEDRALLAEVFRCVHTLKGCAGFAGLERLERLAHAGETLLGKLRDGALALDAGMATSLLATVDAMRAMLDHVEVANDDGSEAYDGLVLRLGRHASGETVAAPRPSSAKIPRNGTRRIAVRVAPGSFDRLGFVVGELTAAFTALVQTPAVRNDPEANTIARQIGDLVGQLDEQLAQTRREPIGLAWRKFPRLARDLAIACNKKVHLEMLGAETEIDKSIADAINDPLLHALRNAIDHGIEAPALRRAAGKPETGRIVVRAEQVEGQVTIEVSDDGRGLDLERIRARAVERGLLSADRAAKLADREIGALVFEPGLSTAEQITTVSGRGIGMDVVRANIEQLGGRIELTSHAGQGTVLRLCVPVAAGGAAR